MKILLAGGGTGGPVAPLLAVAQCLKSKHPKVQLLFVGTASGPERRMAEAAGLEFKTIVSGKLRRYFSWRNFLTPFELLVGFFQALVLLKREKVACIFGAGGYVQVPLIWAGWLLGIPSVIHQQDVLPSLANSLCQMFVKKITVTFEPTAKHFFSGLGLFYRKFSADRILVTGNPVRKDLSAVKKDEALKFFQLTPDLPVMYVMGGGTGSKFLNQLIREAWPKLRKTVQIIHSVGKDGRGQSGLNNQTGYRAYDFIDRVDLAYAAADIVLCRAGLSTISELSYLGKLAIVVPMPDTHQEFNAFYLDRAQAALVLPQEYLSADALAYVVRKLLFKYDMQQMMQRNIQKIMPHDAGEKIARLIIGLTERHYERED